MFRRSAADVSIAFLTHGSRRGLQNYRRSAALFVITSNDELDREKICRPFEGARESCCQRCFSPNSIQRLLS